VLISPDRRALLADFGLAQLEECTLAGHSSCSTSCSPRWTSPQRLQGDLARNTDDIYSFGCIAYYVRNLELMFA
jgi:serine/threonine protein kinase